MKEKTQINKIRDEKEQMFFINRITPSEQSMLGALPGAASAMSI